MDREQTEKLAGELKVLILVQSAGADPWLTIENEGQSPIFRDTLRGLAEYCWIQGRPDHSVRLRVRILNRLIAVQMRLMYARPTLVRRIYKRAFHRFGQNAVGSVALRGLVRKAEGSALSGPKSERYVRDLPTQLTLAGTRLVDSFRLALSHYDFDYLLRINSTCLPVPRVLFREISQLPRQRVYAGLPLRFAHTHFISGAAILMSKDVVEAVVRSSSMLRYNVFEDVALGRLIQDCELADLIPLRRTEIAHPSEVPPKPSSEWPDTFVVRCKAESPQTMRSAPVIEIMSRVHPHLNS